MEKAEISPLLNGNKQHLNPQSDPGEVQREFVAFRWCLRRKKYVIIIIIMPNPALSAQ